jgi:tripartite ATP-independent transporter DctP family solute receptor
MKPKPLSLVAFLTLALLLAVAACAPAATPTAAPTKPPATVPAGSPTAAPAASPTAAAPSKELKFSVVTSEASSWYKGAQKFADLVKERTKGRLNVKVYPGAQLAGGNQVKERELVQSGAIDMFYYSTILYTLVDPRFNVVSMPWIFNGYQDVDKFMNGPLGDELLKILPDKGIVGLAYGENGFRQLTNNKRPVRTPDDMKGLKIRIPGIKMYTSIFQALGANPTVMNFPEVFGALQQGTIDGQENPIDVIVSAKLYEVQKYLTLWNYSYDAIILGVNKNLFDSLSKEDQEILRKSAKEASDYQIQLSREAAKTQVSDLKAKGMEVIELTAQEIAAFKEKVQPVYTEYEPIIGKELLDKFRALSK